MNTRRWLIVLVLIVLLAGGGMLTTWFLWKPAKHDFDKLGGTVLVYEIAPNDDADLMFDPERDMPILVESLQRRLDPDDRGEAYVAATGKGRVEIRIPRATAEHVAVVQNIKNAVTKVGRLEFRILANDMDDREAIADAVRIFEEDRYRKDIDKSAERGLPPPGPKNHDGTLKRYTVATKTAPSHVTYSWIELGPQERRQLNLDNAAEHDATRNNVWNQAKARRNLAGQLKFNKDDHHKMLQGALFYSRACTNQNLPDDERRDKAVEYFVLARDAEFKSADSPERTPKVDGSYLVAAYAIKGQDDRPTVSFQFNTTGGELFGTLTRKNVSERDGPEDVRVRRHLAIILDDLVMSAPSINSEIRSHGQISGNFTETEVQTIVNILRAGALPVRLRPQPVSESDVAPAK